jgi:hypothetical protein
VERTKPSVVATIRRCRVRLCLTRVHGGRKRRLGTPTEVGVLAVVKYVSARGGWRSLDRAIDVYLGSMGCTGLVRERSGGSSGSRTSSVSEGVCDARRAWMDRRWPNPTLITDGGSAATERRQFASPVVGSPHCRMPSLSLRRRGEAFLRRVGSGEQGGARASPSR